MPAEECVVYGELNQGMAESRLLELRQRVEVSDQDCALLLELGQLCRNTLRWEEALEWMQLAEIRCPESDAVTLLLAEVLLALRHEAQGLARLDRLIAAGGKGRVGALQLRAQAAISRRQIEAAACDLENVLQCEPENAAALNNLGLCYAALDRQEEALPLLEAARRQMPRSVPTLLALGAAYRHLGRYGQARDALEQVLLLEPGHYSAQWYLAQLHLLAREWEPGWDRYRFRFHAEAVESRVLPFMPWTGEIQAGKQLLVTSEQGLGDEIMFASCLPDLLDSGMRLILECNHRLLPLFRRSFPGCQFIPSWQKYDPEWLREDSLHADFWAPFGELPRHLRRREQDFPGHAGYLKAAPERVNWWRERLAALGPGTKVGLSWRGGTATTRQSVRSIPPAAWAPLLATTGVHWISLQYGDVTADLKILVEAAGGPVHDWQVANDIDEVAALICALDIVVTVCTAVVHLCGALGRRALVLTPAVAEWRYLAEGDSMPWYPSVRLLRQSVSGDWDGPLRQAAVALQGFGRGADT